MRYFFYSLMTLGMLGSCDSPEQESSVSTAELFTLLEPTATGVDFINQLDYNEDFNIYTYRNFYNGGGVGLGDFDRDGLLDIYFTGNMTSNRLYRNIGDFRFEDITTAAGVQGERAWSTGVSVADVNGDGWMDIYVCNSGDLAGDNKQNELFINQGNTADGTIQFKESAAAYGLADRGYSTHAAFFDYDKDGDLDVYLLNNSYQAIGSFNLRKNMRPVRDSVGGDKLYRNDGDTFTDVSAAAGIYGSVIGFGLGVTVGDIDQDGWQDIYVSNDFFERDYIYMNNGDGTFREELEAQARSISGASMGADMADINNDGFSEVFVTEMLPGDNARLKTKTTFENWDKYQYNLSTGYYHQFTRNMLHLNNGNKTFSEIGRLAGVEATDWSWGALIYDMDNDGYKDIFVANGIYQDLTDQDYINFISNEETMKSIVKDKKVDYRQLIDSIPSEPIPNYAFHNDGGAGLTFTDKAEAWGLATPSHSNGSAYGDLDNDGDLDLIVNNVNQTAFVYRNQSQEQLKHHYLKVILEGAAKNPFAVGTKLIAKAKGKLFYLEQMPVRGFESTVDYRPNFGLGTLDKIDTLLVVWPDDRRTLLYDVAADQTLRLRHSASSPPDEALDLRPSAAVQFTEVSPAWIPKFTHEENNFVDFDVDRLIYHKLSTEGPKIIKGDINADGLEDWYICGARDQSGQLFVQQADGRFVSSNQASFEKDKTSEDTDGVFFDADGDGDQDLYVTSGGNEFSSSSSDLKDRLYLNDGQGRFENAGLLLPSSRYESSSCVRAGDFDSDGDLDLFVGIRLRPRLYGVPASGYILENEGSAKFKNITKVKAPELEEIGMITDALWIDIDQDKDKDLLVIGDWMPITLFKNENGQFKAEAISGTRGWWNTMQAADLDGDGDTDFVLGNHGLNSRFCASPEEPVRMYINDFDQNRTVEQIITCYEDGTAYPLVLRHDLVMQLPSLKKKYLKYERYKNATVQDIFTPEQLEKAIVQEVDLLESIVLRNDGQGNLAVEKLPLDAQLSPTYGILIRDFNNDGKKDILLGGNLYGVKPEVGRYDGSYGTLLLAEKGDAYEAVSTATSGLRLEGEVRDFAVIERAGEVYIIAARNNADLQTFKVK